jgi:dihydropteroate synthase
MKLRCRDTVLSLDRTVVMGVLNVTPDSFSDGGLWMDPDAAVAHAQEMISQGAAIIDVGGESTRPGAEAIPEDEELRRALPVIEALAPNGDALISIDTRKPSVARRAIETGASIVNDTSGETFDPAMDEVCAATGVAVIVMHSRGTPATMRELTDYADVTRQVRDFLAGRAAQLEAAGASSESIVLDPGFGFAKSATQSLRLLRELDAIVDLGYPVLAGTSRKSFLGEVLGLPVDARLEGTLATVAWAIAKGAAIVRVHDVEPVTRVARTVDAIRLGRD